MVYSYSRMPIKYLIIMELENYQQMQTLMKQIYWENNVYIVLNTSSQIHLSVTKTKT